MFVCCYVIFYMCVYHFNKDYLFLYLVNNHINIQYSEYTLQTVLYLQQ